MAITKDLFRNESGGHIGVMQKDSRGEAKGIAVAPGEEVWMDQEEQILTANAPKDPVNNPLINGDLVLVSEGGEVSLRRPLRPETPAPAPEAAQTSETPPAAPPAPPAPAPAAPAQTEETGATPPPQGDPETGKAAPGEEVATPAAAVAPAAPVLPPSAAEHTAGVSAAAADAAKKPVATR